LERIRDCESLRTLLLLFSLELFLMPAPHCLIFERDVTGHRLHHVRHLAEALLELGCRVTLALQDDAPNTEEYRVHLKALEPHFEFSPGPRAEPSSLKSGWRFGNDLMETMRVNKPDRVYITCTEYLTQAAALRCLVTGRKHFPGAPVEGHLNRGTYAYPYETMRDVIRGEVSRRLAQRSPWHITHLLDPWVWDELKQLPSRTEFRVIPEPVEPLPEISREDARRTLRIPVAGRYVSMIGGLRPSKGLEQLLAAVSQLKLAQEDRILLVGKMAKPIRELIQNKYASMLHTQNLVTVDRYVSDFELGCGFMASDVVMVVHERLIGSSGTLVRAAHAQRPLLTTSYGWAGWATERFNLGKTVNISNVEALKSALQGAFDWRADLPRSEKTERFCKFHTLGNQKAHWVAGIGRDCGISLGSLADRVSWDWTMEGVNPARDVWKKD
jgi:glycosyltransferase involved in cell wall biosynthesis